MVNEQIVNDFKTSAKEVLESNILPFWLNRMLDPKGGFYGRMDGHNNLHADAPRGTILHARILWSFSAAYRILNNPDYLRAAQHAKDYIEAHMLDREFGGAYWSVNPDGTPLDAHKQIYAMAFLIYAYAEYFRATQDQQALQTAIELFHTIERYGRDRIYKGYIEAAARDWSPIEDMRLSDKDENTVKSQNTNLHVLEAYTNLYRVWQDDELRQALDELIQVFQNHILQPSGHLGLFFDEQWQATNDRFSPGHDIECSWLIDEAAAVIGQNIDPTIRQLAQAATQARHDDGSLGELDWWTQAETVLGYYNLYRRFGDQQALHYAEQAWQYIRNHFIDYTNGEWFWGILPDGSPDTENDKAGFWKCPYHNSRMCLKLINS